MTRMRMPAVGGVFLTILVIATTLPQTRAFVYNSRTVESRRFNPHFNSPFSTFSFKTNNIRRFHHDDDATNDDSPGENSQTKWSLEADWALMDQLPKFTVGEEPNQRTFWTQLMASTPLLPPTESIEENLMARCHHLNSLDSFQLYWGPSPPLLQDWSLDSQGRCSGTTQDGRTIWFTCHQIGRLAGDVRLESLDFDTTALSGGYVEAVGGRIYELGVPQTREKVALSPPIMASSLLVDNTPPVALDNRSTDAGETKGSLTPFASKLSSILVASILSACIGYTAGMSLVSNEPGPHNHQAPPSLPAPTISSSARNPSIKRTEISISEQRAKMEARVLREQRVIRDISQRLESDQAELQRLRQQEQQPNNSS